jgi:hypothetical protein
LPNVRDLRPYRPGIGAEILGHRTVNVAEFALRQFVEQIERAFRASLEGCVESVVDELSDLRERLSVAHLRDAALATLVQVFEVGFHGHRCRSVA